jgi:hypothetical protein
MQAKSLSELVRLTILAEIPMRGRAGI